MTVSDVHKVVFLLILSVLLSMQEILFQGAFRCVGKYPLGVGLKGLISLGSLSGVCIAVMRGAGPVSAAVVFGAANAVGTGVLWLLVRRSVPWIRFGFGKARREVIYKLLSPAVSFLSFPISNALSLQGILVVIGQGLGPLGVLTFSTARTIARSALQVMELINAAVWPEMSAAFGANDLNLAKRLHRTSCQMSIALSIGAIAFISVFGARIWRVWTINKVTTDPLLLNIMLIQLLVTALWYTSSVVPVAVNRHQTLAKVIVASSVVSLLLAWGLMRLPALQLRGAAIALVVGNALNAIYVLNASLQMVGDNLRDFLASLCRVPRVPNLRLWSWAKP
jgi:O-antigen/teichoic acid export membrane protein